MGKKHDLHVGHQRRLKHLGHPSAQVVKTVKKVASLLHEPRHKASWLDVHAGNIMFRKGRVNLRPVLNDPIAH